MLCCDGYKMFHGTAKVTPANGSEPFDATGTWLYKPGIDCKDVWYFKSDEEKEMPWVASVPANLLSDIRDDTETEKIIHTGTTLFECGKCGEVTGAIDKYCWSCGAKFVKEVFADE